MKFPIAGAGNIVFLKIVIYALVQRSEKFCAVNSGKG